jgi:hypothetical protein
LPTWSIVVGVVAALALIFLLGVGYGQQWGAEQWGPVAAWLSGALTLAAVAIALRQAGIARRQADDAQRESMRLRFDRLVDHEMSRRRECIDAFSALWATTIRVGTEFRPFTQRLDALRPTFVPASSAPLVG